jgi:hypothetical protein
MAGMGKKCALNSPLVKLGFQRDFSHFADAIREFPFLGAPVMSPAVEEVECLGVL